MIVRPYRIGDIEHITRRPRDDLGSEALHGTRFMCEQGNTYVAEKDGIPVAIWGTQKIWEGVAHVWTIVSDEARGNGVSLTKIIKQMLDEFCIAQNIRRCETVVMPNIEENVKWLNLLGFEYECTHKQSSPKGGDLDIYVKFYGAENDK